MITGSLSSDTMKIIFAGTPEISRIVLQSLLNSEHDIVAVYTQPDRQSGRGRKLTMSPVKEIALAHELTVKQPKTLKTIETQQELAEFNADLMIVVAYGLLLPQAVLDSPRYGCWNIHVSLLPRWRGAAPIQRAIEAGDQQTGVCVMQMDAGLDTGDILRQKICDIQANDTAQRLHDRLASLGSACLQEALVLLAENQLRPKKQTEQGVTYANKLSKTEATIDWRGSAIDIANKIRAFNPWPVAQFLYQNQMIRIWSAHVLEQTTTTRPPGTVISANRQGIDIATGDGILRLIELQFPGAKRLPVADILNAKPDFFMTSDVDIKGPLRAGL